MRRPGWPVVVLLVAGAGLTPAMASVPEPRPGALPGAIPSDRVAPSAPRPPAAPAVVPAEPPPGPASFPPGRLERAEGPVRSPVPPVPAMEPRSPSPAPPRKAARPRAPRITAPLVIPAPPPLRKVQTFPPAVEADGRGGSQPATVPVALPVPVPAPLPASAAAGAAPAPPGPAPAAATGWAAARLLGALGAVGCLLAATLATLRRVGRRPRPSGRRDGATRIRARMRTQPGWLARLLRRSPEGDRIEILARSYVGSRESISVVQVGQERFLVGITGSQVSLIARLEGDAGSPLPRAGVPAPLPVAPAPVVGPAVADFAEALRAASPPPARPAREAAPEAAAEDPVAERAIRAALARARERLGYRALAGVPGEGRG